MRVHFTVDMEGMAGMAHEDQADMKGLDFPRMRELLTNEVQAAVEGAKEGGAKEIVICDAHDTGRNLILEKLDEDVIVIEGTAYNLGMMAGISEDFDAAFQIGYHSMRDTHAGTIGHTYSYNFAELQLNGIKVGESGLSAAIAGHFGVPVVLVSGDLHAVKEAQKLIENVVGVPTKEGLGVYGVKSLTPKRACDEIRKGAKEAMGKVGSVRPFELAKPVKMEVAFIRTVMAQYAAQLPLVERTGNKSVAYEAKDMVDAFSVFEVMAMVADSSGREGYL
ncbi:MAG: M55 family metallopeptidase [Thermoplasmata archaeon]|nr:M55 family metallopeptidase [Thermoplasmata archaeon]